MTRGTSNNLFQVATLVRAATALEAPVRVFFEGAAALKLVQNRVNVDEWSAIYHPVAHALSQRLVAADFTDMASFLHDAKEHGDDVRFWASLETLQAERLDAAQLIECLDGVIREAEFAQLASRANVVLIF